MVRSVIRYLTLALCALSIHSQGLQVEQNDIFPIYAEEEKKENSKTLSSDQLDEVYNLAKNVSHSRGPLRKNEDGSNGFRPSFVNKVSVATNSKVMQNLIDTLRQNRSSDSLTTLLADLEFLVHQYDVAVHFANIDGIQLMMNLTADARLSNSALSVMTAAIQGNPAVQKVAEQSGLLEHLLDLLKNSTDSGQFNLSPRVISTLSSFLRHNQDVLSKFLSSGGIPLLAKILSDENCHISVKLKVANLLGDLTIEMRSSKEMEPRDNGVLQKLFETEVQTSGICSHIPQLLNHTDYRVVENTISSINSMLPLCEEDFQKPDVMLQIEVLVESYKKYAHDQHGDNELKWLLFEEMKNLYEKLNILIKKGKISVIEREIRRLLDEL